ncbi:MAG: hypothetical protein ACOC1F_05180, partial [Myxococcota bacterium]
MEHGGSNGLALGKLGVDAEKAQMGQETQEVIDRAERWGAHNYHPLPVVLAKAEGPYVWDL